MGMHQMSKFLTTTAGIALAIGCSSAIAATDWSYNLSTQCAPGVNSGSYTAECGVSNPDLTLSGWSTATGSTTAPTSGTTFSKAYIYDWGSGNGLGIVAGNESSSLNGPHALDNGYGIDALLLTFTNDVYMTGLTLGWVASPTNSYSYTISNTTVTYNDSDLSVYAWTGSGSPGATTTALTGWTLVGDFSNAAGALTLASSTHSSYWLVGAFNTTDISSSTTTSCCKTTTKVINVDAFKVLSVAGNNYTPPDNKVPEPGSMVLMGAGLLGMMALRRRQS